jgi:FkbM family methyltransferase
VKLRTHQGEPPPGDFECFNNWVSPWISEHILAGETYPQLPGIGEVRTVVDVGANCGAASVYFARCYPEATIHAIEPGAAPFELLSRNASPYPNIHLHNIGLYSSDRTTQLYAGVHDSGTASIFQRAGRNTDVSEDIRLQEAGSWLAEQEIESIDVLKVDTEGCEVEILAALRHVLPGVKALYVEYDDVGARRQIDRLLEPTHELCHGMCFLDQGEMIYVRRQALSADSTAAAIREFFRERFAEELSAANVGT